MCYADLTTRMFQVKEPMICMHAPFIDTSHVTLHAQACVTSHAAGGGAEKGPSQEAPHTEASHEDEIE